ncbi:helix-turn-helix domain-containing protein [Cupriavidus sp. 2SB]|uniref:helix-turn-helix domain-containing protein n=1 Tax=Cupriavidus sp. 2SB TaxID=2502199 RepID=UPI0010F958C1|nr:helix-turn-helix domain-containing protein [Cupriavidus sp. 2SB]
MATGESHTKAERRRQAGWRYRQMDIGSAIETALWPGSTPPALRSHFHDEDQLVFVSRGCRQFLIGEEQVSVREGLVLYIAAGVVHKSVRVPDVEVECLNVYLRPLSMGCDYCTFDAVPGLIDGGTFDARLLATLIGEMPKRVSSRATCGNGHEPLRDYLIDAKGTIGGLAEDLGWSREGFSRRVSRELGVGPHAFRLLARLNRARNLLRDGMSPATVAAETGFADQSHLTRCFRGVFGTTPGQYRAT